MPVFEAHSIAKSYQRRRVLESISFALNPGEISLLLGQNGAGKTTLLKICALLLRPESGRISAAGKEPARLSTGYSAHQTLLYSRLSLFENLSLIKDLMQLNISIVEHVNAWKMEEHAHRPLSELSKGLQARASLCRCFMHKPKYLFLDEPSSALDMESLDIVFQRLRGLVQETSAAVLIATHDVHRLLPLANRILLLNQGMVEEDSSLSSRESVLQKYSEVNR